MTRPAEPLSLPTGRLDVRAESLTYGFDGTSVLDEVSFHVEPNESVAIVGPTGVGKSTLAQLLVRLDDPSGGRILIGGVDLRQIDSDELRRAASLVFQDLPFATTVAENIALDPARVDEIERAAAIAQADRFIRAPHAYDTVLASAAHASGGERQRVALARALVRHPAC
jgi:ATP-binding cassette subfamily B protein